MKDKIIYKRVFVGTKPNGKGIVKATGKLHSLGGQTPYFSITTGNGCRHDLILQSMPHLQLLCDIHLSDEDGAPMHTVANAAYHVKERDDKALARHLRIPVEEARDIISDFFWDGEDRRRGLQIQYDEWPWLWKQKVMSNLPSQVRHAGTSVLDDGTRISKTTYSYIAGITNGFLKSIGDISAFFGFKLPGKMAAVRRSSSNADRFQDTPHDPKWYNYYHKLLISAFTTQELLNIYELCNPRHTEAIRRGKANWSIAQLREHLDDMAKVVDMVSSRLDRKVSMDAIYSAYMKDIIDQCFRSYWKQQAEEAIEMLKGEDEHLEVDITDDDLAMEVDGEKLIIEDMYISTGELTTVTCGDREYILAIDSTYAGEKAREYWEDMAHNDKEEFACMVGEETLIKWALGESAGPGTTKVNSLEDWLDLWLDTPEEQWASYDGKETVAKLNKGAFLQMGYTEGDYEDHKEAVHGWVEVVAYRC